MAGGGHVTDRGFTLWRCAGPKGCGRAGRGVRGCLVSGRGAHGRRGAPRRRGMSGCDALVGCAGQGRSRLLCGAFRLVRGAGAGSACRRALGWLDPGAVLGLQLGFQPAAVEQVVQRSRVGKDRRQAGRLVGIALGVAFKLLQRRPALGRAAQAHATHLVGQADAGVRCGQCRLGGTGHDGAAGGGVQAAANAMCHAAADRLTVPWRLGEQVTEADGGQHRRHLVLGVGEGLDDPLGVRFGRVDAAGMAHSLQYLPGRDVAQVAAGHPGGRLALVHPHDDAVGRKCLQDPVNGIAGCVEAPGQLFGTQGRAALQVALAQRLHDGQGQLVLALCRQVRLFARRGHQAFGVLHVEAHAGAHQHDDPAHVQPDHEDDEDGQTGIDGGVLGGAGHEAGKGPAGTLPADAGHQRTGEGRQQAHPRVGHEQVQEQEQPDDQHVGQQPAGQHRQVPEGLDADDHLHQMGRGQRGVEAQRRHHQDGAQQHDAQVVADALRERAHRLHVPDGVDGAFDLEDGGHGREQQHPQTHRPQHAHVHVVDEAHDVGGDLGALGAQRLHEALQRRLDLAVHAKGLGHREGERQHGHDGQQRGVDQAGGAQHQLPEGQVAHDGQKDGQGLEKGTRYAVSLGGLLIEAVLQGGKQTGRIVHRKK